MVTKKKDRNESNCLKKDVNVNKTKVNGYQKKKRSKRNESNCL